jgi:superfamily I DNA/RNA helicase
MRAVNKRKAELEQQADRIAKEVRRHSMALGQLPAMTIHQAKNREFRAVVVLWPREVGGDEESQRRRLYNAITRARDWAVVIGRLRPPS